MFAGNLRDLLLAAPNWGSLGSGRGALSNERPYREHNRDEWRPNGAAPARPAGSPRCQAMMLVLPYLKHIPYSNIMKMSSG